MAGTFSNDVAVSTSITLGASQMNHLILATRGAMGINLDLPDNATWHNSFTCIWLVDNAAGAMTLTAAGSDTINGLASISLINQGEFVMLFSNGAGLWEATFGIRNLTAGSVVFVGSNGLPTQDNAHLFFGPSTNPGLLSTVDTDGDTYVGTNFAAVAAINNVIHAGSFYGVNAQALVDDPGGFNPGQAQGVTSLGRLVVTGTNTAQLAAVGVVGAGDIAGNNSNSTMGVAGLYGYAQIESGTTANAAGLYIDSNYSGGTLTNNYGIKVADQTAGLNNWAIKTGLGQLSWGDKFSRYNDIEAVGNGVPAIYAKSDSTSLTSSTGAVNFITPLVNGMVRLCYNAKVTTPAGVSSVLGGTGLGFQVAYTDADDNVVVTTAAGPTSALNTTQAQVNGCVNVNAKAGVGITWFFDYTSVSGGGDDMAYSLHVVAEQIA